VKDALLYRWAIIGSKGLNPRPRGGGTRTRRWMICYQGRKSKHNFFLADIGIDEVILGYPFFEALLPDVNWRQGKVSRNVCLETEDVNRWALPNH
jgi:hypothetical protein